MPNLEPISPAEAKQEYHETRQGEISETTRNSHNYRLNHFVRWCENVAEIDNMNDVTGRTLLRYRNWRREDGDLCSVSLLTQLSTLRVFIGFCEQIDAVEQGTNEKIQMPPLDDDEESRDRFIEAGQAEAILDYLRKFEARKMFS